MKVELYGNDTFVGRIPTKQKAGFQEAIGKEMSHLGTETIKTLENAKNTLVVDVLDIKDKGMVVDARLFDKGNMPISGKTCLLEINKMGEFLDPKSLAQHFSTLTENLVENAKMLKYRF